MIYNSDMKNKTYLFSIFLFYLLHSFSHFLTISLIIFTIIFCQDYLHINYNNSTYLNETTLFVIRIQNG